MPAIAAPISFASVTGSTASWRIRSNASPNRFSRSYPLPLPPFAWADAAQGARATLKAIAAANLSIFCGLHEAGFTIAGLRDDTISLLDKILLWKMIGRVRGLTT